MLLIPLVITAAPGVSFTMQLPLILALHLGCFFVAGMVCHGELARRRPPAARLTEFYLFLSVGGVLGGVFNALLAPLIFSGPWEYPLALVAACLMKPATSPATLEPGRRGLNWNRRLTWDIALPVALLGFMLLTRQSSPSLPLARAPGCRCGWS